MVDIGKERIGQHNTRSRGCRKIATDTRTEPLPRQKSRRSAAEPKLLKFLHEQMLIRSCQPASKASIHAPEGPRAELLCGGLLGG